MNVSPQLAYALCLALGVVICSVVSAVDDYRHFKRKAAARAS